MGEVTGKTYLCEGFEPGAKSEVLPVDCDGGKHGGLQPLLRIYTSISPGVKHLSIISSETVWKTMASALEGCVSSLRTSMQLLDSSINILDSGVNDYPRLAKVLQTTRVSSHLSMF